MKKVLFGLLSVIFIVSCTKDEIDALNARLLDAEGEIVTNANSIEENASGIAANAEGLAQLKVSFEEYVTRTDKVLVDLDVAIKEETEARIAGDELLMQIVNNLTSRVAANESNISDLFDETSRLNDLILEQYNTLMTAIEANTNLIVEVDASLRAAIAAEAQARQAGDIQLANQFNSAITSLSQTIASLDAENDKALLKAKRKLMRLIGGNAADIDDVEFDAYQNAQDILANAGLIDLNSLSIGTNETDISTNAGNISSNSGNIDNLYQVEQTQSEQQAQLLTSMIVGHLAVSKEIRDYMNRYTSSPIKFDWNLPILDKNGQQIENARGDIYFDKLAHSYDWQTEDVREFWYSKFNYIQLIEQVAELRDATSRFIHTLELLPQYRIETVASGYYYAGPMGTIFFPVSMVFSNPDYPNAVDFIGKFNGLDNYDFASFDGDQPEGADAFGIYQAALISVWRWYNFAYSHGFSGNGIEVHPLFDQQVGVDVSANNGYSRVNMAEVVKGSNSRWNNNPVANMVNTSLLGIYLHDANPHNAYAFIEVDNRDTIDHDIVISVPSRYAFDGNNPTSKNTRTFTVPADSHGSIIVSLEGFDAYEYARREYIDVRGIELEYIDKSNTTYSYTQNLYYTGYSNFGAEIHTGFLSKCSLIQMERLGRFQF